MKEGFHNLRIFLAQHRLVISVILAAIIFVFLLVDFEEAKQSRKGGILIFLEDFVGLYPTIFLMSAVWFGISFGLLSYDDRQWKESQLNDKKMAKNETYAQAARELVEKNQLKMDVWAKALVEARGDENLAKAKYINLRVKEGSGDPK